MNRRKRQKAYLEDRLPVTVDVRTDSHGTFNTALMETAKNATHLLTPITMERLTLGKEQNGSVLYLTRKAEFAASHYYHNPDLSAEENRRIFGKCN